MTISDDLQSRIKAYVAASAPALSGGAAVVAVSGGGDSVATAALLLESGIVHADRCAVAHFDHRLRDAAAVARDRSAVDALCARYGIELVAGAWPDPAVSEAAARDARYAFLARVAHERGLAAIVTGHTSDDQVETVIMNSLRGAGLPGLRGMAVESALPGDASLRVVRPALCVTRAALRAYADARSLAYAHDETNDDRRYLRNRIRRDVLPVLESITPDARGSILRTAAEAREAVAALEGLAARAFRPQLPHVGPPHAVLARAALASMPAAVRPYAYRLAVASLLGDARELDRRHYATLGGAHEASTGAMLELPRGIRITVDPDAVIVSLGPLAVPVVDAGLEAPLPWSGVAGAWDVEIVAAAGDASSHARATALPPGAVLRGRRPGDVVRLRGGRKKLQDAYIDARIPRRDRDAAPVIANGPHVLWSPLVAVVSCADGAPYAVRALRSGTYHALP